MIFRKIFADIGKNQFDLQQPNLENTWKFHDINTNLKPGEFHQTVLSSLESSNKMSGNLDGFHFINSQLSWEVKDEMHAGLAHPSTHLMSTVQSKGNLVFYDQCNITGGFLALKVPPENRFRYRYDTEMSGTHGSLQGLRTGREKSVPTVELINYPYEALIRVTLVTCQENEHFPHPHSLFVKEKLYQKKIYENWDNKRLTKTGHYSDPHYIRVGQLKNDYTARFEGMCIINSKKENFHSSVKEKLLKRCFEHRNGFYSDEALKNDESEDLIRKVETAVRAVDVDFVSLCFEAFKEEDGNLLPICPPVFSEPIGNAKSAKTGKLKISRINKCSGSCKGGEEIWLLVEKINKKGLVVRFSEEYDGKVIWESCIEGDDLILHHQYAIIFKTPPYRDVNITSEVEVLMRLERATQPNQPCDFSEPITFVYEPSKVKNNKGENLYRKESILAPFKQFQTKRPRTDSFPSSFQIKRKTDEFELEGMELEGSDEDIEQLLFDGKDGFELDQAWGKFNVEEFLRFISTDDIDMPMQKDGISHNTKSRRDFFYKLYLLYSKLDENDIKKLTEQISNFKVSKKNIAENKGGLEKDQVKDAASTLLTLRSKALINNNSSHYKNNNDDSILSPGINENKTNTYKGSSLVKSNGSNSVLESCCKTESEVLSPVHMPVIKFNLSKVSNQNHVDGVKDNAKTVKQEKKMPDCQIIEEKMENIYKILNQSGSWQNLAELWHCKDKLTSAMESSNPAKYIFQYTQLFQGGLEYDIVRESLEALNDKKILELFDETEVEKSE